MASTALSVYREAQSISLRGPDEPYCLKRYRKRVLYNLQVAIP